MVVTGGAGFIGRAIVSRLAARGDAVVALVRDPGRAEYLNGNGVKLVASDLSSQAALTEQMRGADAVIHGAGSYRIGISAAERPLMYKANVVATERVLDAAIAAGAPRIVYISTNNVFGDTHGTEPDETYRRHLAEGWLSYYDATKYRAHEAAEKRIRTGAPIVIVQPSQVYGPNDHSLASSQLDLAFHGRLRYITFPTAGHGWLHVHDLADGIVAALDRGRIGETYSLAGPSYRLFDAIGVAARVGGRKPPRLTMPPGLPANSGEVIRAGDGVTYWARHDKATAELGFNPRSLEQGVADTWGKAAP